MSIFRSLFLASFNVRNVSMYLPNNKQLYLKRWCSGVGFAVVHIQLRVRGSQKSSIFFNIFFLNLISFIIEMVRILNVISNFSYLTIAHY